MFHFLEYPFSRGFTHITSPSPYDSPDFDAGFMNDKRDMAPMVWGYIQSRETARRMNAYAGEVTNMHPHFAYDSPARARDMDIATRNAYGGPDHITSNIQHGSWTMPVKDGKVSEANILNSNAQVEHEPLKYSKEDIAHIEKVSYLVIGILVTTGFAYLAPHQLRSRSLLTWEHSGSNATARPPGIR